MLQRVVRVSGSMRHDNRHNVRLKRDKRTIPSGWWVTQANETINLSGWIDHSREQSVRYAGGAQAG